VDEIELRRFLGEHYSRLVGAVSLVTGDLASAEDAVQEAIVRAWERTERGDQIEALDRWVAAVALNLSRSRLRRLRVERLARPRLAASSQLEGLSGERIDVVHALAALPRRQREVAVLRYYLDRRDRDGDADERGHRQESALESASASRRCARAPRRRRGEQPCRASMTSCGTASADPLRGRSTATTSSAV
jgi:RNA polymerase sigma factor (sigma-70 family)